MALMLVAVLSISITGQNEKTVLLIVNTPGSTWTDCGLLERLTRYLNDHNGIALVQPQQADELNRQMAGRFDKQVLLAEGVTQKFRYIFWCDVVKQRLDIENGFSLPLFFKQKRVKASLEVEYHILDCQRGRSVSVDRICVERHGPATLQSLDYTEADPNLLLTYVEKKALFDRLEEEAARKLLASFDDVSRQR